MENPILTISIMISGEINNVKKCLDSVKPLMEIVPSELILTDTGCKTEVRNLIEQYTDHIIDFVWCKDFSAARNAGLMEAKGKWFLYVDDDEWFENTDEIAKFLLSKDSEKYNVAYYTQRNYLSPEAGKDESELIKTVKSAQYVDHYVDRIIRITPELHFEHRVHEAYTGIEAGRKKKIDSYVHHYGYVYTDEKQRLEKYERNYELLRLECQEHPDDMRMWYQMAIAPKSLGLWDEAVLVSKEAIVSKSDSAYWDMLHTNILSCLEAQGNWEELIKTGEDYLNKNLYPYSQLGIHQYLIKAYWMTGMYNQLLVHAKAMIIMYEDYKTNPEKYDMNQLLKDEFLQKDRISAILLIIIGAIYSNEDESANCILTDKIISEEVADLYNDSAYRNVLAQMILDNKPTDKKISMLERLPFGKQEYSDFWIKAISEIEIGKACEAETYIRPTIENNNHVKCEEYNEAGNNPLSFQKEFFEGETRNGFYIEPFMKNAWAAEIQILDKVGQICRKNGLRYYADWGTLLGTIRHQGFIPWDDDIDICMPRNDMFQLAQIIEEEYPELKFSDIYSEKKYGTKASRVLNRVDLLTARDDLKESYGFPMPVGIDIFALDNLPDDEAMRKELKEAVQICAMAFNMRQEINSKSIINYDYFEKIRIFYKVVDAIEQLCSIKFSCEMPGEQEILILLDEIQSMYRDEECRELTQMDCYATTNYSIDKDCYSSVIMMPFENIMVPVPKGYEEILREKYGEDYMTPKNIGSGHDYPFYNKLFEVLQENNPVRTVEDLKDEIVAASSVFYRKFVQQSTKPRVTYNTEIVADSEDMEKRQIRMAESEVIAEISRICADHNWNVYGIITNREGILSQGEYGENDEIHLGMFRKDYVEFLTCLPAELDSWFDYRDLYHYDNHEELKAYIITDNYMTDIEDYMKRFHGCPHIVGVDITPIDAVFDDTQREEVRQMLLSNLIFTAHNMPDKPPYNNEVSEIVNEWCDLAKVKVDKNKNLRNEFMKSADMIASSCKDENSAYVKLFDNDTRYKRKHFEKTQEVLFGNMKVMIPIG